MKLTKNLIKQLAELENVEIVVKTSISINSFICNLRITDEYIKTIYLNGGCYQFHLLLAKMFPGCEAYINKDKDHIITKYDEKFYDINGEVFQYLEEYNPLQEKEIPLVESWSFSKNNWLYIKQCENCDEPLIPQIDKGQKLDKNIELEILKREYRLLSEMESQFPRKTKAKGFFFVDRKMDEVLKKIEYLKSVIDYEKI